MTTQVGAKDILHAMGSVRVQKMQRTADRILTGDYSMKADGTRIEHTHLISIVKLRIQVWDGAIPVLPVIILEAIPANMLVYPPEETHHHPAGGVVAAPALAKAGSVAQRLKQTDDSKSLLTELSKNADYLAIIKEAEMRRSKFLANPARTNLRRALPGQGDDPSDEPVIFLLGMRVLRPSDVCTPTHCFGHSILRIRDLMKLEERFGVGWSECMLDLSLNREADLHLSRQMYDTTHTFSITIESIELSQPATSDAPFGLAPSTYVVVEHGSTIRTSQIESDTRTPVFEWTTGSINFEQAEPLKLRLYMATSATPHPKKDTVIGQMWLEAPVLPLPLAMMYPEIISCSLGSNVGIVHLTMRGPALRRYPSPGCICWCCCCAIPVCGSPPCCPAPSVTCARSLRCCYECSQSRTAQVVAGVACCCFIVAASVVSDRLFGGNVSRSAVNGAREVASTVGQMA